MEGRPLRDGVRRAREMLWPTLQVNWPFWSMVQLLTFGVLPKPWRVAWISVVHVFWNAFLSSLNQRARAGPVGGPLSAVESLTDGVTARLGKAKTSDASSRTDRQS